MTALIKVITAKPFFSQAAVFLSLGTNKGFKPDLWNVIFNLFVRQYFSLNASITLGIPYGVFTSKQAFLV